MKRISETTQLRMGVLLSYISEGVGIAIGLLYTPLMLSLLGKSEYGLYQLVYSVVSYLSLIGLGFSSSYQRYYALAKKDNNREEEISKLNGMYFIVFAVMAMICLLCSWGLGSNAHTIFGNGLSETELATSRILLYLMGFNMAITFPNSLFTSYLTANKHFIFIRIVNLIQQLANPFVCFPLLLLGYGSVAMVVVSLFLSVMTFVFNGVFCVKFLYLRLSFKGMEFAKLKELWGFTFFIFLNQIVNQINWNVDKYLLGRYCGTTIVAIYSIGGQLRGYYSQFSTAISNVFIPKVNEIVVNEKNDVKISNLFIQVGRIQAYVIMLVATGFTIFGSQFVCLWVEEDYKDAYYIALMFFWILVIPYIQNLGIEIQRAKNKHRVRSIVYAIVAVINIFISIPLIKIWGGIGAAIGTVFSILIGNIVFMNFYYSRGIGLDISRFWKNILRILPGMILPFFVGYSVYVRINWTWYSLILGIVIYSIVYICSVFCLSMNAYEKNQIKKMCLLFKSKLNHKI